jgi:hypothetical protein
VSDQERLDELEAELAANVARPLRIRGVDRQTGEVVEGVVFDDHCAEAGLVELVEPDDAT